MTEGERYAQALHEQLRGRRNKRFYLNPGGKGTAPTLWSLFNEVAPEKLDAPDRAAILAVALTCLAEQGSLTWSRERDGINRDLPLHVTLVQVRQPKPEPKKEVWHPKLNWVDREWASLTERQRELIRCVNSWLRRNPDAEVEPLRERALQIFGEQLDRAELEKELDGPRDSGLFARGLTLDVLCAEVVVPPLQHERIGPGELLLVVENATTWSSLKAVLSRDPGRVGVLAWGAGEAFTASVRAIGQMSGINEVRYFGDLDRSGLWTPAYASRVAGAEGIPEIRPATELIDALLRRGIRGKAKGQHKRTNEQATESIDALVQWLDPQHQGPVREILREARRLPQEWLSRSYLGSTNEWRP
ncbi:hypothetical protein EV191_11433 [Tamaricihabitans halophyticus]|uniref:Wadjet protein JetD C-terminal domain-containing protein n=1 Tax=Tamaricihabitans halophyticus TaxID=1262583 RepID=A0A4V2SSB3_9PSEU|nr:hypothetical protein [Tamaricihabitans halophyticus]TCP46236.1 hypothetical protein EV191_11433 [Tamaricihabitans halophyticus]